MLKLKKDFNDLSVKIQNKDTNLNCNYSNY